jgi:hypothetical protein
MGRKMWIFESVRFVAHKVWFVVPVFLKITGTDYSLQNPNNSVDLLPKATSIRNSWTPGWEALY